MRVTGTVEHREIANLNEEQTQAHLENLHRSLVEKYGYGMFSHHVNSSNSGVDWKFDYAERFDAKPGSNQGPATAIDPAAPHRSVAGEETIAVPKLTDEQTGALQSAVSALRANEQHGDADVVQSMVDMSGCM